MGGLFLAIIIFAALFMTDRKNGVERPKAWYISISVITCVATIALCNVCAWYYESKTVPDDALRVATGTENVQPMAVSGQLYNIITDKNGDICYYFYVREWTSAGEIYAVSIKKNNVKISDSEATQLHKITCKRKRWVQMLTLTDCKSEVWTATLSVEDSGINNNGKSKSVIEREKDTINGL